MGNLHSIHKDILKYHCITQYLHSNDLKMLLVAGGKNVKLNTKFMSWVAKNGYLKIMKWARGNNCPWDEYICTYAALNGHLEVLKWARANNCPWDKDTVLMLQGTDI